MRARAYIVSRMDIDLRIFCTKELGANQWYIIGAAVHAYNTRTAVAAVSLCIQACHMALRVSHVKIEKQIYKTVLTKVAMVAKSWDATDPKSGYVLAAERAVQDVVVLCIVNRAGASRCGASAAGARGLFMEVADEFIGTDLDDREFRANLQLTYHKLWRICGGIWIGAPCAIQIYADPQA